ncbi:MAG: sensor histidine kinase [Acidobacteriota bacterium]
MRGAAFPLRARILLLLVCGVVLFGSINVALFRTLMLRGLRSSLEAQGRALADLMAEESVPLRLRRDFGGLSLLGKSLKERHPEVLYVVFYGPEGGVEAGTFDAGVPAFLGGPSPAGGILRLREGSRRFLDFSAQSLQGRLGSVRLGLSEEHHRRRVEVGERVILAMVLLFFLGGAAGAFLIAQDIHRDTLVLAGAVQSFRLEGPVPPLPVRRRDEIGTVARAVQEMMGRLQALHREHTGLLEKLREADRMASVGLIASGLAHDINNPLSGLLVSLERLARDPGNREKALAYLPTMMEAARHIREVLQNLLAYVRRQRYAEAQVGLAGALEKARALVEPRLGPGVVMEVAIPDPLPPVRFDPGCLLQVLLNLFLNAADAMEGRSGCIRAEARLEGHRVRLDLADEGGGIPEEVRDRLFEPFVTTKPPGKGTGLGLATSLRIMRDHGGDIRVESRPGEGTTVTLLFRPWEA